MGEKLANKINRILGENNDIEVVMPVPDTSRVSALQCAKVLNCSYREGFIKNRYIARTFIMPVCIYSFIHLILFLFFSNIYF